MVQDRCPGNRASRSADRCCEGRKGWGQPAKVGLSSPAPWLCTIVSTAIHVVHTQTSPVSLPLRETPGLSLAFEKLEKVSLQIASEQPGMGLPQTCHFNRFSIGPHHL